MNRRYDTLVVVAPDKNLIYDAIVSRMMQLSSQLKAQQNNGAETANKTRAVMRQLIDRYKLIEQAYRKTL
jgi:hypothetical protein